MLVAWIVQKFDDVILLGDAKPEDRFWMLLARGRFLLSFWDRLIDGFESPAS